MSLKQPFPHTTSVKIFPQVLLAGRAKRTSGALRLWMLARAIDTTGSGKIEYHELVNHLTVLGVNPRTQSRWIKNAIELGLLERGMLKENTKALFIRGLYKVARILDLVEVDRNPVQVEATKLAGKQWESVVWSAYLSGFQGSPVSRERLTQLTGLTRQSQRRLERNQPIKIIHNFVLAGPQELLGAERKFGVHGKNCFIHSPSGRVAYRLPDSRTVQNPKIQPLSRGRCRKVNTALKRYSCNLGRVNGGQRTRVFYSDIQKADKAARIYGLSNLRGRRVFLGIVRKNRKCCLWEMKTAGHG